MTNVFTGIDIVSVKRVSSAIDKWGNRFLHKVFTKEEIDYSIRRRNIAQHLSARFAAKEAVFKALPDQKDIGLKDIKIVNTSSGKPSCEILKPINNLTINLSIAHVKEYAIASAVIIQKT